MPETPRLLEKSSGTTAEACKHLISSLLCLRGSYILTDSINQTLDAFSRALNKQIPEYLIFLAVDDVINISMIMELLTNVFSSSNLKLPTFLQRGYFGL